MTPRWGLILAGVALFVAGLALFGSAPEQERVAEAGVAEVLREIGTVEVARQAVQPRARFSGVLEARRTVKLFAETQGLVLDMGAEALDRVEAGQQLVRIDPVLATIEVEKALAAVARSESELALAESNLARRQELAARNVLSSSALDDAVNRERVAAASLREARALLRGAREDLANKTVRAPFAGEIRSFPVEIGEYVRQGQQLAELVDLSTARVMVGVADREVVAIQPGQAVALEVEAWASETFAAEVLRVGASADPETRRFPVEIEAPNPAGRLLPGMVVSVAIDLGEPVARTVVPREATSEEFGLHFVYVVERGGDGPPVVRQRRVVIRPVAFQPEDFEILGGLEAGEEIAVTEVGQLRDGERVRAARPPRLAEPLAAEGTDTLVTGDGAGS
ncbi:MAG: efflux RND transporter periplasmic adaptor subunit [Deltaproteobacteria bacterium]|nr:efflux RND transporter periplasmic adaptor subunit [Deltaproteobacteria bacterium]MBW2445099.1 efflux RND transporter periplasmic adaptor subunit [Deltaproteobacteria bacterium]